jgi:outer membrane protein OmpA-like peptidoglycan-associated protein
MIKQIMFALFVALPLLGTAQQTAKGVKLSVAFDGHVYDSANGTAMPQAKVLVYDDMLKVLLLETTADLNGFYTVRVPKLERYRVVAEAPTYFDLDTVITITAASTRVGFGLHRKPGYVFDITMFDKAYEHNPINTLRDCKVEIYNNTTREQELTIAQLPKSTFNFAFAEGNHYTVLVRKPGYLNRRIEVYVNVKGCILCVDGMGVKEPDVVPLMTHGNEIGFFLGAIDLDSILIGKRFQLNNIYYDFNKWAIRPEAAKTLDKLAVFLKDNPGITVELGSHTDARGNDPYNMTLSDKRARAAVDYLVMTHGISPTSITAKGYGESQLANLCDDGVGCDEQAHQLNRRTEIKITGILDKDPLWDKSLKEIIEDVELYRKVIEQEKRTKATR